MSKTPTIVVRQLDANNDPIYGNGKLCFLTDLNAVAQLIKTSLLLFQGELWNHLKAGLPLFQSIIAQGENNRQETIALLIQTVILSVEYVNSISDVQINYVAQTRKFTYSCNVQTVFGTVGVVFNPGNTAVLPLTS